MRPRRSETSAVDGHSGDVGRCIKGQFIKEFPVVDMSGVIILSQGFSCSQNDLVGGLATHLAR